MSVHEDVRRAALYAALLATFSEVHPACDQFLQLQSDALGKGKPGTEGARHCARHVATYTAGQAVAAWAATRAFGYRVPPGAALAGLAITAVSHYAIDRRGPFIQLMRKLGKGGYLDHATVVRREDCVDSAGPGTALMELDQAAHRLFGVAAALATAFLATREREIRK